MILPYLFSTPYYILCYILATYDSTTFYHLSMRRRPTLIDVVWYWITKCVALHSVHCYMVRIFLQWYIPNTTKPVLQIFVLFYECIWHGCKLNGIPLSTQFMYLNNVLRWPEDGYYIVETCRHIINWNFVILLSMLCL